MVDQLEDLDEKEGRLRRNLESIVADLLAIFRTDIVTYVEREIRNRFVAYEAFAEGIDDASLMKMKARTTAAGREAAAEICDGLSGDMEFWFGPEVPLGEGKTLEAHTPLAERLARATDTVNALLGEFGFPAAAREEAVTPYSPPAYFVNGKYAPGLAESFWKNLEQLAELREARRQQDAGRRRAVQRHRWDTIDKPQKG
jgi:hypothetical protein